ncbi:hypothetical protein HMY34_14705 [Thiothrix subterranea]|nr:hypothetical protein HMY34_14705 [Thiothrix subterranea]
MKYAFIQNHSQQFNLKALCCLLEISRSTIHGERFDTRGNMRQTVFEYI